jgi:hypothetical protein
MDTIKIKHPTLDDGRRIVEVPAQSWPHYAAAGWVRDDEPAQVAEPPAEPPAEAPPEPIPSRRSRITSKE